MGRAVEQGPARVGEQRLPLPGIGGAHEDVVVEGGGARHHADGPRVHIHGDDGAGAVAEGALRLLLQRAIERGRHRAPAFGAAFCHTLHVGAVSIYQIEPPAVLAGEERLRPCLQPADAHERVIPVALLPVALQLLGGDGGDPTDDVGARAVLGIEAPGALAALDAGNPQQSIGGKALLTGDVANGNVPVGGLPGIFRLDLLLREVQRQGEVRQQRWLVLDAFRDDAHGDDGAERGERGLVVVVDVGARRRLIFDGEFVAPREIGPDRLAAPIHPPGIALFEQIEAVFRAQLAEDGGLPGDGERDPGALFLQAQLVREGAHLQGRGGCLRGAIGLREGVEGESGAQRGREQRVHLRVVIRAPRIQERAPDDLRVGEIRRRRLCGSGRRVCIHGLCRRGERRRTSQQAQQQP